MFGQGGSMIFTIQLPSLFKYRDASPENKEEELMEYLEKLSDAIEDGFRRLGTKVVFKNTENTEDNYVSFDENGDIKDSGVAV